MGEPTIEALELLVIPIGYDSQDDDRGKRADQCLHAHFSPLCCLVA